MAVASVSNPLPAGLHVSISVNPSFQTCEIDMVSLAQQGCLERLHRLMLVTTFTIQTWHILGMLQKFTEAVKSIFGKQVLTLSDIFKVLQSIYAVTI